MKAVKGIVKFTFWTVFYIVLLAILALLTLPLWVGPAVTGAANSIVPGIVKAEFRLNEFGLNQYSGRVHVGDMTLINPTNYPNEACVKLGKLDVALDTVSCFTKKIHIYDITLDGLDIAATADFGNFMQIAENAQGDKKEKKDKEAEKDSGKEDSAESPKVVIDKLTIKGLTVKVGMAKVPVPTITLEGIGADKQGGADWNEVLDVILNKVLGAASELGNLIGNLGAAAIDAGKEVANQAIDAGKAAAGQALSAGKDAANAAMGAGKEAASQALSAGGEAVGGALKSVGSGAKEALGSIGSETGKAFGAAGDIGASAMNTVGEGATDAMKAAGKMGGSAVNAVGEGAGAAVDAVKDVGGAAVNSIKGLFK